MQRDIIIGEDRTIQWIDFVLNTASYKDIDYLISPVQIFFGRLQIHCVAECCGIDAFSFLPNDIRNAGKKSEIIDLEVRFTKLIEEVSKLECEVIGSTKLNQLINRQVFLKVLEHIKNSLSVSK